MLSWYASAELLEPWLQPVRIPGSPDVLTPLAIASASSRFGALLSYLLRNYPQALAAWRVSVNGASARSVAAAAGLWTVVLEADVRAAVAPAVSSLVVVAERLLPSGLSFYRVPSALWARIHRRGAAINSSRSSMADEPLSHQSAAALVNLRVARAPPRRAVAAKTAALPLDTASGMHLATVSRTPGPNLNM